MIRAYSQRILPLYSGCVQIAESERARAQSFDGISWEIQYLPGNDQGNDHQRKQCYGLDRSYFKVAKLHNHQLTPYVLPAILDAAEIEDCINELSEFLQTAQLPFPMADSFEYWLLDGKDESPLALIFSCCEESQMTSFPSQSSWTAIPHSKLKIENTAGEQARNEAPVNHRFQSLVSRRAGNNPQAAWFVRSDSETDAFPCLMVNEDWHHEADHDLCHRYLMRNAPRLLMLQGLAKNDRERLELAAKEYAIEVDQYFPLYPEVNDQRRMSAIRVEARLRRNAPQESNVKAKEKDATITPMSKDMRIFET